MKRAIALTFLLLSFSAALEAAESVDYLRDIKPILAHRCYACHGALKQEAGLRLDSAELVRKGGEGGAVIELGDAAASLIIERVTAAEAEERMPPEGKPLEPHEIAALRSWINSGAQAPQGEQPEQDPRLHWAFQKPVRPAIRSAKRPGWSGNPLDALLAAEHEAHGLEPLPEASKHVLLRRVYLDLVGLPPTRQELGYFLADSREEAFEEVVNRLLERPAHGERWARHWMDVWRYSDWYGRRESNDVRNSYPQIWRWRDWIVRSLNEDKGYDQMVASMLAADEITPADDQNVVATGFIARNWYSLNYNMWMKDLVEHTGKAFLGLTFNCALCHNHKYDPIEQEDYFKFRAFFEPLELRQDRVAGLPDPGPFKKYVYPLSKDPIPHGLVRVFDEKLDAETYMFTMGDERSRVKGKPPIAPGLPKFLTAEPFKIEPVNLPPVAYYPGLKPFVQREELVRWSSEIDASKEAVVEAQARLESAQAELAASAAQPAAAAVATTVAAPTPTNPGPLSTASGATAVSASAVDQTSSHLKLRHAVEDATADLRIEQARLANARAQHATINMRIDADNARYKGGPGNVEELSKTASTAGRPAEIAAAQEQVLRAAKEVMLGQRKFDADNKVFGPLTRAKKKLTEAEAKLAAANQTLEGAALAYAPLSPVYPQKSTGRRGALARWIAGRDNPLTARVAVNHIWMHHFGRPLVESTFDFGRNGKKPSHPEVLDFLAVELMDHGWSMKHIHRLIVTSKAYRMQSQPRAQEPNLALDSENKYLWRYNPRRAEAEVVRDSLLYVAGSLDQTLGGKEIEYEQGLTSRRRSIYFSHHGESKMPLLDLFDAANPCDCYRRTMTVRPQQALALTNSQLAVEQSRILSKRLWDEMNPQFAVPQRQVAYVEAAFQQVLSRSPTPAESALSKNFLAEQADRLQKEAAEPGHAAEPQTQTTLPAAAATQATATPAAEARSPAAAPRDAAARARESFVRALMSHSDFLTIR